MVIIYKFDDLSIEEVNPVTQVVSGFDKNELRGKPFPDLLHPARRKEFSEAQRDLVFRGTARLESVIVTKAGEYKQVLLTLSLVELNGTKIVMALVKDVSDLVREREEESRRKKELEDFWNASIEREERIKHLRKQLSRASRQIEQLKGH
jgi:PAS domain S-box-containing protein